jgi:hypothetical protein
MKLRVAIAVVVLFVGALLWRTSTRRTGPPPQSASPAIPSPKQTVRSHFAPATSAPEGNPEISEEPSNTASALPGPVASKPKPVSLAALEEATTTTEPGGTDPVLPAATALENMRTVFRQYALRFGGNPVGSNPEITAALNGQNARQVVFLNPDDGMQINARGELVDNWGTPYFFHQLSATEMEIHSAGPDRKMWTSDDLVVK